MTKFANILETVGRTPMVKSQDLDQIALWR
jgi:hypothetical protein